MLWIIKLLLVSEKCCSKSSSLQKNFYLLQHPAFFFFTYSWHLIDEMQALCFAKKKGVTFFSKNLMQHI